MKTAVLVLALALAVSLGGADTLLDVTNRYAMAYNAWARTVNAAKEGVISVQEFRQYQEVKTAGRAWTKRFDAYYRGER